MCEKVLCVLLEMCEYGIFLFADVSMVVCRACQSLSIDVFVLVIESIWLVRIDVIEVWKLFHFSLSIAL